MLEKSPRQPAAGLTSTNSVPRDPLLEAFRHFELDPKKSEDRDRLLQLMAQRLFGRRRGRPKGATKGANKLTLDWYLQLMLDASEIQAQAAKFGRHGRPKGAKTASLLKQKYPKRYGSVSNEWLRQCLLMRLWPPQPQRLPGLPNREDREAPLSFDSSVVEVLREAARETLEREEFRHSGFTANEIVRLILLGAFLMEPSQKTVREMSPEQRDIVQAFRQTRSPEEVEALEAKLDAKLRAEGRLPLKE